MTIGAKTPIVIVNSSMLRSFDGKEVALVMADPLQPCRVLMALVGGSVPGMNFEAFLQQANDYEGEDDLFSRHTRFWSELNLTHPVAVRRVKELMEWVQTGAYDRIRHGDYPRRGEEAPALQGVRRCGGALPRALLPDPRPDGRRGPGAGPAARQLAGPLAELRSRGRRGRRPRVAGG